MRSLGEVSGRDISMKKFFSQHEVLIAIVALLISLGAFVGFAANYQVPRTAEGYQYCLEQAELKHDPLIACRSSQSLLARGMTDPVAYFTLWLTAFTVALAIGGFLQSALVSKQIRLSREEFIAAQRPKLKVRKLSLDTPIEGKMIKVRYELINTGATRARISGGSITVRISEMPAAARLYMKVGQEEKATKDIPAGREILAGQAVLMDAEVLQMQKAWGFDASDWWCGRFHVIGEIQYMDDNDVVRRTGFYRTATEDRNRFVKANIGDDAKADYEYED